MSRIVVQFDRWAAIVLAEGFDTVDFPNADASEPLPCVIHKIAFNLTKNVKGLEGDVQRKSLDETLFFTLATRPHRVGFQVEWSLDALPAAKWTRPSSPFFKIAPI